MSPNYRYAVVQDMPTYWANIMSDVIYESGKVTTIRLLRFTPNGFTNRIHMHLSIFNTYPHVD